MTGDRGGPMTFASLRAVAVGLVLGQLALAGVAAWVVLARLIPPRPSTAWPLGIALVVLGLTQVAVWPLLRRRAIDASRRQWQTDGTDAQRADRVTAAFLQFCFVTAVLAEAWGVFGSVVVVVAGRLEFLAAPLLAAVLLSLQWPTQGRMERFIREVTREDKP
jgi:hypothetical protein